MFSITRGAEQEVILQNEAQFAAQIVFFNGGDIQPINFNAAAVDIVETRQQVGDGGFPRAGRADQGNHLARSRFQADIFQHRHPGIIPKRDIFQADMAADLLQRNGSGGIAFGKFIHRLENPLHARQRSLDRGEQLGDHIKRTPKPAGIVDEGGDLADGGHRLKLPASHRRRPPPPAPGC